MKALSILVAALATTVAAFAAPARADVLSPDELLEGYQPITVLDRSGACSSVEPCHLGSVWPDDGETSAAICVMLGEDMRSGGAGRLG